MKIFIHFKYVNTKKQAILTVSIKKKKKKSFSILIMTLLERNPPQV
jgi:hypothetical protein